MFLFYRDTVHVHALPIQVLELQRSSLAGTTHDDAAVGGLLHQRGEDQLGRRMNMMMLRTPEAFGAGSDLHHTRPTPYPGSNSELPSRTFFGAPLDDAESGILRANSGGAHHSQVEPYRRRPDGMIHAANNVSTSETSKCRSC